MQIVNGYVCQTCTDVSYAKKGIDPAHPKDPPKGSEPPNPGATEKARTDTRTLPAGATFSLLV